MMTKKKSTLIITIVILLCITIITGVTYALWNVTRTQEDTNIVTSSCFNVTFEGNNEIKLLNNYPIDDNEGMKSSPYTFTITNTCDLPAIYNVNLETLVGTTFKSESIKVGIDGIVKLYSQYSTGTKQHTDSKDSRNIISGVLQNKNDSVTYNLRLWIDSKVGNDEQNKKFDAKIVVTSSVYSEQAFCQSSIGTVWEFDYVEDADENGYAQEWIAPCAGNYQIELWGAGKTSGAYTSGNIELNDKSKLYINIGQEANNSGNIIYNSNTKSVYANNFWRVLSGSGATDIRIINGTYTDVNSLASRIMVAAGQGGEYNGGAAGGLIGYTGGFDVSGRYSDDAPGYGGSQVSGGISAKVENGSFGFGAQSTSALGTDYSGSGGGGYYGGGAGFAQEEAAGGGGGSSFISGHLGCVAVKNPEENNDVTARNSSDGVTVCTEELAKTDVNCSKHYLEYVFTNTHMIDGLGYNWTTEKEGYVGQTQPDGTIKHGHAGNGYARITYLGNN